MQPAELRYGQKLIIAYTRLDGFESVEVVEAHWLKKISQKIVKKLSLKSSFPFIGIKTIKYTDVLMNASTDWCPMWRHIYAIESPRLMAKKFGIEYSDLDIDRINDDLDN